MGIQNYWRQRRRTNIQGKTEPPVKKGHFFPPPADIQGHWAWIRCKFASERKTSLLPLSWQRKKNGGLFGLCCKKSEITPHKSIFFFFELSCTCTAFGKSKQISAHFQVEKVLTGYPAYYGGMKVHDFLISVNGQEVFELNHAQLVNLIKTSGNSMQVAVERQVASCVLWKGALGI